MADKRVSVTFSESAYKALEQISQDTGKTMAVVLRDAIALEKWVRQVVSEGGRILVERNGQIQELLVR